MRRWQARNQTAEAEQKLGEVEHKLRLREKELIDIQVGADPPSAHLLITGFPPPFPRQGMARYPLVTGPVVWYRRRKVLRKEVGFLALRKSEAIF